MTTLVLVLTDPTVAPIPMPSPLTTVPSIMPSIDPSLINVIEDSPDVPVAIVEMTLSALGGII